MKLFLSFVFIMATLAAPPPALSEPASDLLSEIESRQEQLVRHQMAVDKLSRKEREAYSRLARAEDRLNEISKTLESQEDRIAEIVAREAEVAAQYEKLSREMDSTRRELADLLKNIWPIFLESQGKSLSEIMHWSDLDREMTWLCAIYHQAEKTYELLQAQSADITAGLVKLQIMKDEYQAGLAEVDRTKNQLLNEKLGFLRELQEIRAQRLAGEEMISKIIDVIDSLNYRVSVATHRQFETLKGRLVWPAKGNLVSSYNPSADPPHSGVSLALGGSTPIKAISWGQVMHNDTLRGFGRVVIILHGDNYYSLYAYLSESSLQIGQEVEKGETIGLAGFYPQINDHGIYFELRFNQKPINPIPWLEES